MGHDIASTIDASDTERRRLGGEDINRNMGRVVSCNGSRATVAANTSHEQSAIDDLWTVGKLVTIVVGENRVVALVFSVHTPANTWSEEHENQVLVEVELMGEISSGDDGKASFSAGITSYPYIGALVHRIRASDLAAIYSGRDNRTARIGQLAQDNEIDAAISVDKLLDRHFAVVGTTGVGKSTAVALLLQNAIAQRPDLRILILDPHNEFASAFPGKSEVIDTDNLDLPFWLFRLEEFAEVLFRGRPGVAEEIDILRELISDAKRAFRGSVEGASVFRASDKKLSITADTPIPYRVADLVALIDERIGKLDRRDEKPYLRTLKTRIMAAINDPRYRFMFSTNTIQDTILDTIGQIFRIPDDGKPIAVFQLAGIPSEVINSVASVLCRMAFDIALWGNGRLRILVVCEEAHRYVPADEKIGFFPTRQAIARIAKEGRKYGVSLGVITQRPGELDPTILSQCSTVFAMRLSNERDQEIIRSAIPDSSVSTISFLSSIGNREAIAFGDAVPVPMRMRFGQVGDLHLPKTAGAVEEEQAVAAKQSVDLKRIVQRMRQIGPEVEYGFPEDADITESEAADTDFVFGEDSASDSHSAEERRQAQFRQEQRLAAKSAFLRDEQRSGFKQSV